MRIGVDTGGTFTDVVGLSDDGQVFVVKLSSTPADPAEAVLEGVRQARRLAGVEPTARVEVVHGTTVATNALLERTGGPTVLVATRGFEDLLVLRRQARPQLYALHPVVAPPLVDDERRVGVVERLGPDGEVVTPLTAEEVARVVEEVRELVAAGARSVAVALLHAYASDRHERLLADALGVLGVPVSLSSTVLPEQREYERTSTTVVDAFVAPVVSSYLGRLEANLAPGWPASGMRIMQSSGGSAAAAHVRRHPVRTILSGPAAGVVGARAVASRAGLGRVITFDMGGTSTDVALVQEDLGAELTTEGEIAGHPVGVASLRVHTVAAGGGSIARVDEGGALKVGPASAGAVPGPACYGRGGRSPTVTDAMVVLGRLDPERFLGGEMRLDAAAAARAIASLAAELGRDARTTAEGVARVATAVMARAIRVISVERGHDPRDYALVAFGGAGGLFACAVADELAIPRILVPPSPGLLCAWGALAADVTRDFTASRLVRVHGPLKVGALAAEFAPLEASAHAELDEEGVPRGRRRLERRLDVRYVGQSYELSVLVEDAPQVDLAARFHELHFRRFGFSDPRRSIERVALRVHAVGLTDPPPPPTVILEPGDPRLAEHDGCPVLRRARLQPGVRFTGPALVVEYSSTTWLAAGWTAEIDRDGAMHLRR